MHIAATIIISDNPERLCQFYRNVIGIPLREEHHGQTALHFGCTLGTVHFAIHPASNFDSTSQIGRGSIRIAFAVEDMQEFIARIKSHQIALATEVAEHGFGLLATLADPDGNIVEITQLSRNWLDHLNRSRIAGNDLLSWNRLHRVSKTDKDSTETGEI